MTGRRRSWSSAVSAAIATIRADGYDVVLNNSLGPQPYTSLAGQPMLTILHTPPTLEKVLAVITEPGWQPDPRHAYVSVSEFNSAAWRAVLPDVTCVPNGIQLDRWVDDGCGRSRSGRLGGADHARRRGCSWRSTPSVAPTCGWSSAARSPTGPTSTPRSLRGSGRGSATSVISATSELARQLARGAVFVSSSIWAEPFGLTLVEAMSCGTPVAAFANGAAAEIVTPDAGRLADAETAAALAVAVEAARRIDRGAVRSRAEDFDAMIMVDRYEELLQEVSRRRVPVPVLS